MVDLAVVGQYHGPEGTAAISVISPFWNLIYSLGLLMGIGGSVLFSTRKGESAQNERRANEYFSTAVIGGIFNVFGDVFFVFTLDMGIMGAGLATAMGSFFSVLIMLSHFSRKSNSLHFIRPQAFLRKLKEISVTGFSTFFIDVAMACSSPLYAFLTLFLL